MALKRTSTASMFDSLKKSNAAKQEKDNHQEPENAIKIAKDTNATDHEKKQAETNNSDRDPAEEPVKSAMSKSKEQPAVSNSKPSVKVYDFGGVKEKELKKVRKQFVFTPTYANWIKETAKYNGISENNVIENLIEMAMNSTN